MPARLETTSSIVLVRSLVLSVSIAVAAAALARAQPPTDTAEPPTPGALTIDGQAGRYLLGGAWLYRTDPSDVGLAQGWWQDVASTASWSQVSVPSSFNAGDFSNASFDGSVAWYRRDFTLPSGAFAPYVPAAARNWIIRFESVNYGATVWLNGRAIGSHVGANLPFEFDLRGLRAGMNQLIVRVDSRRLPGELPPGPGSGWWNFGGILREVYLRAVQRADISQVEVTPQLPCPRCPATISEQVLVRNVTGLPQSVQLQGAFGSDRLDFGAARIAPYATWSAAATTVIAHPRLWSLAHPFLYRATLRLSDQNGRQIGGYITLSGIRRIALTPDGRLTLNWRPLNLRGVELREQDPMLGGALDPPRLAALVSWVRALGATVIRSDPLNPQIEEMADRDGLLIWSDIPVNQWVSNAYLSDPVWLASAHALLHDDILANVNHPSVLVWGIGNELPTPATRAEASYIAGAVALGHKLDPTRPVGMAISDWPGLPCQSAYRPLDVIGFNEYFGWFDAGGGLTDDRDALGPFLDSFRTCYPNKALFISEFGFDGNRNGPVEERGTYQFQADAVGYHLGVYASKPWLSGAMYFILQDAAAFPDFSGGNPRPNPPINPKGLLDVQGNQKPAWAVVASIYKATRQIGAPITRPAAGRTRSHSRGSRGTATAQAASAP